MSVQAEFIVTVTEYKCSSKGCSEAQRKQARRGHYRTEAPLGYWAEKPLQRNYLPELQILLGVSFSNTSSPLSKTVLEVKALLEHRLYPSEFIYSLSISQQGKAESLSSRPTGISV